MSTQNIRDIVIARGKVAAVVFNWTPHKIQGFFTEVLRRDPMKIAEGSAEPQDYGLTHDDVTSPGPERSLPSDVREKMGRHLAASALASWAEPKPQMSRDGMIKAAAFYCDPAEMEATSLADIEMCSFDISAGTTTLFNGDPVKFLRDEHAAHIQDGRAGFEDLLLEKIREPAVIRAYPDGSWDIADGWHRVAAKLAAGDTEIDAIVVPLPSEPELSYEMRA